MWFHSCNVTCKKTDIQPEKKEKPIGLYGLPDTQ